MNWSQLYPQDRQPTLAAICEYIQSPLWEELCAFIEMTYGVDPLVEYSKCGMDPGWNVKYKRGGRALCSLYMRQGYFTCMVVVGSGEQAEAELLLTDCDPTIQELYQKAKPLNGSRWLVVDVTTPKILEDVKRLVLLRSKPPVKKTK